MSAATSSHSSPYIDHRDRVTDAMDDLFDTDTDMEYFTTSAEKHDMSPVLDDLDAPRGPDLCKMVDAYERQFHLNHSHHSMSLSLTPAITSFDLMDQNEKWHEISSRTREVSFLYHYVFVFIACIDIFIYSLHLITSQPHFCRLLLLPL